MFNSPHNEILYFNMSCIILHVSIYINQTEVGNNLMIINILQGLAFKNFEFCPHSAFTCFVCNSVQTQFIYLHNINIRRASRK